MSKAHDTEKYRIKPLDDKGDYRLWKIRIEAACDSKGFGEALTKEYSSLEDEEEKEDFISHQKRASNLIVAALSDKALRVVRSEIGNPYKMMEKLNARYDSKSAATRIAKMSELTSMSYDNLKKDMDVHIDQMAGILEQLLSMNTPIPDELSIALFVSSIRVPELAPVTVAVKTLSDRDATWENVTARLLEEYQMLKTRQRHNERAAPLRNHCELCKKSGHLIDNCWLNPKNPKNKLEISPSGGSTIQTEGKGTNPSQEKSSAAKDEKRKRDKKTRVAVARAMAIKQRKDRVMMLDSGTTSHMTNSVSALRNASECDVSIALGDDSEISATSRGTRTVVWVSEHGETEVHLSDTLASPELAMSLLSVPVLTRKGLCVCSFQTRL